jgi:hypothetical protein
MHATWPARSRNTTEFSHRLASRVLFFHTDLAHRSDQNRSHNPRWSMICCYNAAKNDPYKESHHPRYTRLSKVPDSATGSWNAALCRYRSLRWTGCRILPTKVRAPCLSRECENKAEVTCLELLSRHEPGCLTRLCDMIYQLFDWDHN